MNVERNMLVYMSISPLHLVCCQQLHLPVLHGPKPMVPFHILVVWSHVFWCTARLVVWVVTCPGSMVEGTWRYCPLVWQAGGMLLRMRAARTDVMRSSVWHTRSARGVRRNSSRLLLQLCLRRC